MDEKIRQLQRFCPSFSLEECEQALRSCDNDVKCAMKTLDQTGVERLSKQLGVSKTLARD